MSRKHYVMIAEALKFARLDIGGKEPEESIGTLNDGVSYAAEWIAQALAADNPKFDRPRFLKAAGVTK